MIELSHSQIDAIRSSTELSSWVIANLSDPTLASKASDQLSAEDYDYLHDACVDALRNDAPAVMSFTADMGHDLYPISIEGIPGAYFVSSVDYPDGGAFSSLDEALSYVQTNWGEYIVSEPEQP